MKPFVFGGIAGQAECSPQFIITPPNFASGFTGAGERYLQRRFALGVSIGWLQSRSAMARSSAKGGGLRALGP